MPVMAPSEHERHPCQHTPAPDIKLETRGANMAMEGPGPVVAARDVKRPTIVEPELDGRLQVESGQDVGARGILLPASECPSRAAVLAHAEAFLMAGVPIGDVQAQTESQAEPGAGTSHRSE